MQQLHITYYKCFIKVNTRVVARLRLHLKQPMHSAHDCDCILTRLPSCSRVRRGTRKGSWMSASWSSITTLSGLTWEYQSTPSLSSPSSTARQRLAPQTWALSWCTAGTALITSSWAKCEYRICWCAYANIALRCVPQCRGWPHRNLHCHWQHAATDQGQKHSQRPGFSQTYPHTTQLPSSDWGKPKIGTYVVKLGFFLHIKNVICDWST